MAASPKNIFITGATGFIGQHLLNYFDPELFQIFALTRNRQYEKNKINKNIKYLIGDINNIAAFSDTIKICDYFIHIAAEKRNENDMYKINVLGMISVLEELKTNTHIKLVHISSSGVYGIEKHPEQVITENSECFPNNTYEKTKLESEKNVEKYHSKHFFKYVILRPSNILGETDKGRKILNLCQALINGRFFYMDKTAYVNYVYIDYLTMVINEIINKNIFTNEIYNINTPINIYEFIECIKMNLGVKSITRSLPAPFYPFVWFFAKLSDLVPEKFQFLNNLKLKAISNKKIYSTNKIKSFIPLDDKQFLFRGIENLIANYKKESLL